MLRRISFFILGIFILNLSSELFAADIDLADIQRVLSANPKSVEEFLTQLPESYKSRYNLQKKGRGLQEASMKYPRAIVFGDTAKTIMTFNGHPSQKKFNEIEVMTYDELLKKYEFRVINFQSSKATLSEKNPAVCMRCHLDSRPQWDNYPDWIGMYGQENDRMTDEEIANLKSEEYKSNPRYSALPVHKRLTTPPLDHLRPRFNAVMGIYIKYRWGVSAAEIIKQSGVLGKVPGGAIFSALACYAALIEAAGGDEGLIFSERLEPYLKKQLIVAKAAYPNEFEEFKIPYDSLKTKSEKFFYVSHFVLQGKSFLDSKRSMTSISPDLHVTDSFTGTMHVGDTMLANLVPVLPNLQHLESELVRYCDKINCGSGTAQKDYDKITKFLKYETLEKNCYQWIDSPNIY